MDEDDKKDLVSCYLNFRLTYESRGGDKFDFPTGDSFLRFIHIHGYDAVKKMTKSEMAKNVAKTWAEFELIDDNSEVELKMTPAAAPKKNILSYLLPMGGGVKKLKVGFVYEKTPQDSEWCYTHELGRQYIDDTFGDQIETYVEENVIPEQSDEAAINRLIEKGCDLIFLTSSAMNMAGLKAAIAHPSVKILDCSLNISHKYIRSYYARMFEAKFITGIIAGSLADDDNVGYIADNPVYGACANINAFALGVKFVNPRAKVYLEWNSIKDNDSEENLAKKNISIISNQDMITPGKSKRKFGLYKASDSDKHLAMPVWHWGVFYEKLIQSIMSGSWSKDEDGDNVKALNYWWGMSAGVVDFICSPKVPVKTRQLVEFMQHQIMEGGFSPFSGELYSQDGIVQSDDNRSLTPEEIINMRWLADNVNGSLPHWNKLNEDAKAVVEVQGVDNIEE